MLIGRKQSHFVADSAIYETPNGASVHVANNPRHDVSLALYGPDHADLTECDGRIAQRLVGAL